MSMARARISNVYGLRRHRRIHGGAAPPPRFPSPPQSTGAVSYSWLIRLALGMVWKRQCR